MQPAGKAYLMLQIVLNFFRKFCWSWSFLCCWCPLEVRAPV